MGSRICSSVESETFRTLSWARAPGAPNINAASAQAPASRSSFIGTCSMDGRSHELRRWLLDDVTRPLRRTVDEVHHRNVCANRRLSAELHGKGSASRLRETSP